jgi:hypothetical protein
VGRAAPAPKPAPGGSGRHPPAAPSVRGPGSVRSPASSGLRSASRWCLRPGRARPPCPRPRVRRLFEARRKTSSRAARPRRYRTGSGWLCFTVPSAPSSCFIPRWAFDRHDGKIMPGVRGFGRFVILEPRRCQSSTPHLARHGQCDHAGRQPSLRGRWTRSTRAMADAAMAVAAATTSSRERIGGAKLRRGTESRRRQADPMALGPSSRRAGRENAAKDAAVSVSGPSLPSSWAPWNGIDETAIAMI